MALTSTTLSQAATATTDTFSLVSVTGLQIGDIIAVNSERARVVAPIAGVNAVKVQRGVMGTAPAAHDSGAAAKYGPSSDVTLIEASVTAPGISGTVYTSAGPTAVPGWVSPSFAVEAFKTIAVPTQSDIVADATNDTLNVTAGAGIALTTNATTDTLTITATGGGTPGGSDTQVQFNDSNTFGGDSGLTYNKTTDALTAAGMVTAGSVRTPLFDNADFAYVLAAAAGGAGANLTVPAVVADDGSWLYLQIPEGAEDFDAGGIGIFGGAGVGDGDGGAVEISGGAGVDGNGGDLDFRAGASATDAGGLVFLIGGAGAIGGAVNVHAGNASDGSGGNVSIQAGTGGNGNIGGNLSLEAGSPSGPVSIASGNDDVAYGGHGGPIDLTTGTGSTGHHGGDVRITLGAGGAGARDGLLTITGDTESTGLITASDFLSGDNSFNHGFTVSALATAGAPTVTPQGTTGATNYSYKIVAKTGLGHAAVSSAGSTATGNAVLDADNFNRVTWSAVTGARTYDVYRTVGGAAQGMIAEDVTALTLDDTGLVGDAGTAPTTNTTGVVSAVDFVVTGSRFKSDTTNGHTAGLAVYDVDGAAYVDFLTWTNGNTPAVSLVAPTGGTLSIQPTTLKSSDGSTGLTQTVTIGVVNLAVKNGLITGVS